MHSCDKHSELESTNSSAQRRDLYKKRLRTREFRNLVDIFKAAYSRKPGSTHLYMEGPKSGTVGWRLKEWELLRKWLEERFSQKLYWTEIHGCMHGLQVKGEYVNKPWYVLTTDFDFFCSATIKCDGSHAHRQIVGIGSEAAHSTAFYPISMVRRVVQIWKKQWFSLNHSSITKTVVSDESAREGFDSSPPRI